MSAVAAPGKLFIAGEYSVVTPGQPAVLTAVAQGIRAFASRTSQADFSVRITAAHFGETPVDWHPGAVGADSDRHARFSADREPVLRACDVLEEYLGDEASQMRGITVTIESDLVNADGVKFGFGSSGAVVVAVLAALSSVLGRQFEKATLFRLAALAVIAGEERASCADVAVSVLGGWVFYRSFDRHATHGIRANKGVNAALNEGFCGAELRSLPPLTPGTLVVGHSGVAASTRQLVAKFDHAVASGRYDHSDFNDRNARAVLDFVRACDARDVEAALAALRDVRATLADLDSGAAPDGSALGLITPPLAHMTQLADAAGAVAKFSGAGGGDCAIALTSDAIGAAAVRESWTEAGYPVIPIDAGTHDSTTEEN